MSADFSPHILQNRLTIGVLGQSGRVMVARVKPMWPARCYPIVV